MNDPIPTHPEFAEVTAVCPPGANPAPVKTPKAVSKTYFISDGMANSLENGPTFGLILGNPEGFRTKDEVAKFVKTLSPGEYTLLAAFTKKIVVSDVRRVKGV